MRPINLQKAMRHYLYEQWEKEQKRCPYPKNLKFPEFIPWMKEKGFWEVEDAISKE